MEGLQVVGQLGVGGEGGGVEVGRRTVELLPLAPLGQAEALVIGRRLELTLQEHGELVLDGSHELGIRQLPTGLGVLRVEFDGLAVAGDGRVRLALAIERIAQVGVEPGYLRVEFNGRAEADDGRVVIQLHIAQNGTQFVVGIGELRIEFDGLLVAGDGLVQLALVSQPTAQADVGLGLLRVELDGLPVAGDGLVQLALAPQRTAQVEVGICGAWLEPDLLASRDHGGFERLLGLARPASRLERLPQANEMPGIAGT